MSERVVLSGDDLRSTLVRIAHEIIEKNPSGEDGVSLLAIVGIHTRGAVIARRLHALVNELAGAVVPIGDVDISFYRDDAMGRAPAEAPVVHSS
ncbi:MAG: bifunctional pyr operon transcriptional regulator/uracil phosphoribosyltransferase, partial [Solirubrobacterales bacterium]